MRRFLPFLLLVFLALPSTASAVTCGGNTCSRDEVGPFMQGITKQCAEAGSCQLTDIMIVVANAGNFILGIVGSLVLLMYIYGGFVWLTAAGNTDRIAQGKKVLVNATIGLIIVFVAFVSISSIPSILRGRVEAPAENCSALASREPNQGWQCIDTSVEGAENVADLTRCQVGLCPDDPAEVLCCPSN